MELMMKRNRSNRINDERNKHTNTTTDVQCNTVLLKKQKVGETNE